MAQLARHRLHHDFLGVKHAVYDDAETLAADLRNHDETVLDIAVLDIAGLAVEAEQVAHARQRQQLVAQTKDGGILDAFDTVLAAVAGAHKFDHGKLRDGEALAPGFYDQCRDDRERERDLDGEAQPDAGNRLNVDSAADLVDIVAHHIHADAAARHAGDFGRGGKPGREDELVNLRFRQLVDVGLGNQTLGDRLVLDALGVEAAAIVGNLNDNVAAFVIGR